MVVISGLGGLANAWLLGIYDGHGGRQTMKALLEKLHVNVLSHLRNKAASRWQHYLQRALCRIQDIQRGLDQFRLQEQRALVDFRVPMPSPQQLIGLLRLLRICQWLIQCQGPSQESSPKAENNSVSPGATPSNPHFLTICTDEDVHSALEEAFIQTDHEILRDQVIQSGATACVCLVRPVLRVDRVLDMDPEEISDADWALFSQAHHDTSAINANPPQKGSELVGVDATVAHLGDSRAVLAYMDGHAERLTHPSDHKATSDREVSRVESLGGWVFGERVNGMLAIGRAFGDWSLKLPADKLQQMSSPSSPSSGAFDRIRNIFGTSPTQTAEETAGRKQYVVSNEPDVRTVRLTAENPAQLTGGFRSPSSTSSSCPETATARQSAAGRVPAVLVLGCDGLFDVCSDQVVARLALEFLLKLAVAHPDMTTSEAAEATARMLIEEAIGVRESTDNVSVLVALLHPFGFAECGEALSPEGADSQAAQSTWLTPATATFASLAEGVARHVFTSKNPGGCPAEAIARGALEAAASPRNGRFSPGSANIDPFIPGNEYLASAVPPGVDSAGWAGRWLPRGLADTIQEASHRIASVIQH